MSSPRQTASTALSAFAISSMAASGAVVCPLAFAHFATPVTSSPNKVPARACSIPILFSPAVVKMAEILDSLWPVEFGEMIGKKRRQHEAPNYDLGCSGRARRGPAVSLLFHISYRYKAVWSYMGLNCSDVSRCWLRSPTRAQHLLCPCDKCSHICLDCNCCEYYSAALETSPPRLKPTHYRKSPAKD